MITAGELRFVRDILEELCALADPSEYLEEDIQEAIRILNSLETYDSGMICEVITELQHIEQEEKENE